MGRYTLLIVVTIACGGLLVYAALAPVGATNSASPEIRQAGSAPIAPVIKEAPGPTPPGMRWIRGGTFQMGDMDSKFEDERPVHLVTLDGFWMDET
ncbi:MAG TPA: hypothetical protein VGM98_11540, partial [Schlesneria sp.]